MKSLAEKRFNELYNRAYLNSYSVFTEFLNLEEQSILKDLYLPCTLNGGYDNAERVVAGFGDNVRNDDFPVTCVEIKPAVQKFADGLSHRDFLGALMNLGIKRELLGDIIVYENIGYVFCLDKIADYITDNLSRVKHTTVKTKKMANPPVDAVKPPKAEEVIMASQRLDVAVCQVYKLSRSDSSKLFEAGKIFVNSKQTENRSYQLKEGDLVSVRGFGRFKFISVLRKTKKDRLVAELEVFR